MNDEMHTGDWDLDPPGERTELAHRESGGITVRLLWSRSSNALAVAVRDVRGAAFELVLAPNERPLDVFRHPYAYAAERGLTAQHIGGAPVDALAADELEACPQCMNALHLASCDHCRAQLHDEVAAGLARLDVYLGRWALFTDWSRATRSANERIAARRNRSSDGPR
jgi:hypothetical protein